MLKGSLRLRLILSVFVLAALVVAGPANAVDITVPFIVGVTFDSYALNDPVATDYDVDGLENTPITADGAGSLAPPGTPFGALLSGSMTIAMFGPPNGEVGFTVKRGRADGIIPTLAGMTLDDLYPGFGLDSTTDLFSDTEPATTTVTLLFGEDYNPGGPLDVIGGGTAVLSNTDITDYLEGIDLTTVGTVIAGATGTMVANSSLALKGIVLIPDGFFGLEAQTDSFYNHFGSGLFPKTSLAPFDNDRNAKFFGGNGGITDTGIFFQPGYTWAFDDVGMLPDPAAFVLIDTPNTGGTPDAKVAITTGFIQVTVIPEPSSILLLGSGLLLLGLGAWRKRKSKKA